MLIQALKYAYLFDNAWMSTAETACKELWDARTEHMNRYEPIPVPQLYALGEATTGHIVGEGPFQPSHQQVLPIW